MKLLGWMHRKFRQNSSDPFKDQLVIGQAGVDSKHVKQSEKKYRRKSFPARVEYEEEEEEEEEEYHHHDDGGTGMYELFPGFLAIGTLGSSATSPTFAISSVENITEKEDEEEEATENELKLINDELEKVLVTKEDHEYYYYYSSARNSSHVSTDQQSNAICPLQGYLLGSGIECLSELKPKTLLLPNIDAKKEHTHNHNRTSLGELFQRSKLADDNNNNNNNNNNNKRTCDHQKESADKSHIMHLIKKKLKKRILHQHASSRTAADSDTKLLHKILHMFHKKVHPENSTAEHKFDKYEKNEKTNIIKCEGEGGHINPEEDIVIHPKRVASKEKMRQRRYKSQSNPFQFTTLGCGEQDSYENNKEHWIKTDADYLVLEL